MAEFKCNECERNFSSQETLDQHNRDTHSIGRTQSKHELKQLKKQEREREQELEKKEVSRSKLLKQSMYIVFTVFLIVLGGGFLLNSSPTAKLAEQSTKQTTETVSLPVKVLGNYYKYSTSPSAVDGKVRILFIGAEFCPFCAAERWPIVEALSRFGSFSGLKETTSASFNEPFLDLATYNFMSAKYDSTYVKFDHKETADRNFRRLESLTSEEESLFNKYNPRGSIPFLLIGGRKGIVVQVGAGYSPGTLQALTFSQVENSLKDGNAKITQAIGKEANIITALICYNADNQPADVCNKREIASLISQLR